MSKPTILYDMKNKPVGVDPAGVIFLTKEYGYVVYDSSRGGFKPYIFSVDPTELSLKDIKKLRKKERDNIIELAEQLAREKKLSEQK